MERAKDAARYAARFSVNSFSRKRRGTSWKPSIGRITWAQARADLAETIQIANIALWQKRLATLTHWFLYLLILTMTVLGWAATNFRGWPVKLFGALPLPALANKGDRWAHTACDIHSLLVNVLLALVAVHVLAAMYHHFIARDRVLRRML